MLGKLFSVIVLTYNQETLVEETLNSIYNQSFKNIEFEVYLIGYGTWRFLIEFIRGDDRGEFLSFIKGTYSNFPTPSQYFSVILIAIGIYLLVKNKKRKMIDNE